MTIINIKTKVITMELVKPIVVTFGVISTFDSLILEIETDTGLFGYGEAAPFAPVTGETIETVKAVISMFSKALIGENPLKISRLHRIMDGIITGNTSAKAAVDIALHDIYAKTLNVPLYVALGGDNDTFESDKTVSIGTVEEMVADVESNMAQGFRMVKLKAGNDSAKDIRALRAIREACGENLVIRMDANQGWHTEEAIRTINEMEAYGLDAIEQPIPGWDFEGLRKIQEKVNIPVMADESLHSEYDAVKLIKSNSVNLFNIKLMKSKGILGAGRINSIAEAAGIECMIGCMGESPVAITAGAHFAAAKKNLTRVDLDILFAIKPYTRITGGVQYEAGVATLPSAPGLGVDVDFKNL